MHPYVWYLPFFTLYSTVYPILYILGDGTYGLEKYVLIIEWLAMVTFIITIGFKKIVYEKDNYKIKGTYLTKSIYYISCIFILMLIMTLLQSSGYTSKNDLHGSDNALIKYGYIFVYLAILCFSIIYTNNLLKGIRNKWFIITAITLITSLFLFTGERDIVLRLLLIIILVSHVLYKEIKASKLIIVGIASLVMIPILQRLKTFGLTGEIREGSSKGIIYDFLYGEFSSAGRNLQILVSNDMDGVLQGKTLINALLRPLDYFISFNTTEYSALTWFAKTFFPGRVTGMGFTYIGEGYINFGIMGVLIWSVLLGLLIKVLYRKSNKSFIWLIVYIMIVPISIYSLRADLTNILSPLVKQIFIPIIMLFLAETIMAKSKTKKEEKETLSYFS